MVEYLKVFTFTQTNNERIGEWHRKPATSYLKRYTA